MLFRQTAHVLGRSTRIIPSTVAVAFQLEPSYYTVASVQSADAVGERNGWPRDTVHVIICSSEGTFWKWGPLQDKLSHKHDTAILHANAE